MTQSRHAFALLLVVGVLSATVVVGPAQAGRMTSCTGPNADGDNADCKFVLFGGEMYEIEASVASYVPWKGAGEGQELCAGASPLGESAVTGQCVATDTKTPNELYGATLDPQGKSTIQGTGLVFTMPATVQAGGVKAYTVNIKSDTEGNPIKRFVTSMVSSTDPYPSSGFAPIFVGATLAISAALATTLALF